MNENSNIKINSFIKSVVKNSSKNTKEKLLKKINNLSKKIEKDKYRRGIINKNPLEASIN